MKRGLFLCLIVLLTGCSSLMRSGLKSANPLLLGIVEQAEKGDDPELLREGFPSILLLLDGLLAASPDNRPLLVLLSQANMSYALGFVEHEDRERAGRIFWKGKEYGMRALKQNRKFVKALDRGERYSEAVKHLKKKDLPALFWTANNWAGWMNLNLRNTKALFDQPKILALMNRAIELDDEYYYGGPHLFFATYYATLPPIMGGSAEKSKKEFDRVNEINQGTFLMADVFLAEYYAPLVLDQELFTTTLQNVINTPIDTDSKMRMMNELAKVRAKRLLEKRDEIPW